MRRRVVQHPGEAGGCGGQRAGMVNGATLARCAGGRFNGARPPGLGPTRRVVLRSRRIAASEDPAPSAYAPRISSSTTSPPVVTASPPTSDPGAGRATPSSTSSTACGEASASASSSAGRAPGRRRPFSWGSSPVMLSDGPRRTSSSTGSSGFGRSSACSSTHEKPTGSAYENQATTPHGTARFQATVYMSSP